ncbi:MAG: radical SAM family heme chaperone HemW [Xenococcaceae cyanobacterium MO_207.B15]|nr:radical SAM family heme chaperone HemW [Xenococcaceae cyanobacterium MO_207.B15]
MNPTAAYLHIPFCRRRCYYCDFAISVVGDRPLTDNSNIVTDYINYLCQEIRATPETDTPLQTIFFGGGTPSLLPVKQLAQIIDTLQQKFKIAQDAEISMEIDPNTFNQEKLQGYLECGVNRVSLGIQTFDEKLLQICGRTHTVKDIFQAIEIIKKLSIKNFSLDLITGLPYQTLEQCQASLEIALKINPSHLSCYDLVLEPVTVFGKKYQPGKNPLPTDETTAAMYHLTQQLLTINGYQHYEISNYAQPGYQCQHNRIYWENKPYYGFGMGAASYVNQKRYTRPRTRREYYNWVKEGAVIDVPETSKSDRILETLMLGLRLAEGVNLSAISQQFGGQITTKILDCLQQYQKLNWVIFEPNLSRLRLKDPEGFLFSNQILTTLFELDFSENDYLLG